MQFKNLTFLLFIVLGLILSCQYNTDRPEIKDEQLIYSGAQLIKMLESNIKIEKSKPFNLRQFDPLLNDQLIGFGVAYGCYREGQAPGGKGPSKEEIFEDLTIIAQYWNHIRVYNADDDTENILSVIKENQLPVKMMLGVWLANEEKFPEARNNNIKNVLRCIELTNRFSDIIVAVNVGNETQVAWSYHKMDTGNLVRYIRTVRNNTQVPVTTADDYNFWNKEESKNIASEIDFIVTHIHPLWNGKKLENAMRWMDSTFADLTVIHPGKLLVLGETGWATEYNREKMGPGEQGTLVKGEVNIDAQGQFLIKYSDWISEKHIPAFLFEAFDEPWKGGGVDSPPNEIEKHWGLFYEDRRPKESFKYFLNEVK